MNLSRRSFLGALAVPVIFGSFSFKASAYVPPTRTRGTTVRNIVDYGASTTSSDNRAAIQKAIDSLPTSGGTVIIPAGVWNVGTVTNLGIRLRSNMLLLIDPAAVLKARANSATRQYILYIPSGRSNIEIAGGTLIGDRNTHTYSGSSTHEWGHGIQCAGSRVTIRDIRIQDCTGDGICVGGGGTDVVISNIVSTNNRRQGLSLTQTSNVKVFDSEFSYTNGTAPECGIDLEPDEPNYLRDVWIENCRLIGNKKHGLYCYNRVERVTVTKCLVEKNKSCGIVIDGTPARELDITFNTIRLNSASGIALWKGGTTRINNNTFYANYTRQGIKDRTPDRWFTGWSSTYERDILRRGGTNIIGANFYT